MHLLQAFYYCAEGDKRGDKESDNCAREEWKEADATWLGVGEGGGKDWEDELGDKHFSCNCYEWVFATGQAECETGRGIILGADCKG